MIGFSHFNDTAVMDWGNYGNKSGPTVLGTRRAVQRTRGIPAGKPWSNLWFWNRLPIRWSARECLCAVSLALPQDVEDVKFVINFDYPNSSEDYIHRIGRTGRCEQTGTSYAFFTPNNSRQARDLVSVLREANQKVNPKLDEMASMRFGGGGGNRFGNGRNRWGGGGNGYGNSNGFRGAGNRTQGNRWSDTSFGNGVSTYKS